MENKGLITVKGKELVAAGHKFAANISADTPLIDMAKMVSELATQLDVALTAAAEACKQRDAVTAESHIRCNIIGRMIGQYSAAGYHAVQNSMNPAQSLLYDALQALETPATDAYLNAVRADAIESQSDLMMWASIDEDIYANSPHGIAECLDLNPGDEFEVMVAARLPGRIYRMVANGDIQLVHQLRAGNAGKDGV